MVRWVLGVVVGAWTASLVGCVDGSQDGLCEDACDAVDHPRCGPDGVETCVAGADGCLVWGPAAACGDEQTCSDGVCLDDPGKGDSAGPDGTIADPPGEDGYLGGVWSIDAVLDHPNGKLYFFRGGEYIRYDVAADTADAGYPAPIAGNWAGLFERDIDAVVRTSATEAHFFSGDEYILYDLGRDAAAPGYPVAIADAWPGLFERDIDAALAPGNGKIFFFRGGEYLRWDIATARVDAGYPRAIAGSWPGLWERDIDAAFPGGPGKLYFFRDDEYIRYDWPTDRADAGYPLPWLYYWPGLWDGDEGTGDPEWRLPDEVAAQLRTRPADEEIAARRARVVLSAGSSYEDLTPAYPLYVASIEERLGVYGCGLLRLRGSQTYRFRCATDTSGALPLDIEPYAIGGIDWASAAYHRDQVSQGDFLANAGTPLSVFGVDGDVFYIHSITANRATGSISSGLNIKVRFTVAGVEKIWGFSHLNTMVPAYVLEAYENGTPLSAGTVFGFIGYTGNLWIGAPPARDQAYVGTGRGLPAAHTHIWFATGRGTDDLSCHEKLAVWARQVLDFSGIYPFGGG